MEWRPIETAPDWRDGEEQPKFLGWTELGAIFCMRCTDGTIHCSDADGEAGDSSYFGVKYWAQLPPAPPDHVPWADECASGRDWQPILTAPTGGVVIIPKPHVSAPSYNRCFEQDGFWWWYGEHPEGTTEYAVGPEPEGWIAA